MKKKQIELTIVTYNVMGIPFNADNIVKTFKNDILLRHKKAAKLLNDSNADIVLLQEILTSHQLNIFTRNLFNYPYHVYEKGFLGIKGGLVIFSKKKLKNIKFITYSTQGSWFNKTISAKILRMGMLLCELEDAPIRVINTHLTANFNWDWSDGGYYMRYISPQLDQLASIMNTQQITILGGDMNMAKDSVYYERFLKQTQAIDMFSQHTEPTMHAYFAQKDKPCPTIDYLLISQKEGRNSIKDLEHIIKDKYEFSNGTHAYISDHIGLKATVKLHY